MKRFRKNTRLPGYDYAMPGAYFVTICTDFFRCIFGTVKNEKMLLNPLGSIADECWNEIPLHYPRARLDYFQVMPNHVHGILFVDEPEVKSGVTHTLGNMIGSYKSAVTRRIHSISKSPANHRLGGELPMSTSSETAILFRGSGSISSTTR